MATEADYATLPIGTILLDVSDKEHLKEYRHIRITRKAVFAHPDGHYFVDCISVFVSERGSLSIDNMGAINLSEGEHVVLWSPADIEPTAIVEVSIPGEITVPNPRQNVKVEGLDGVDLETESQRSQPRG